MEKNLTACYRAWSIPDVCTVPCVPASMWKMRGDFSVGGARVCFRIPENPCSPLPAVTGRANLLPPVADFGMKEVRTKKKKHMTKDVNEMKKKRGRPALGRTRKLTKGVTVKFSPVSYEALRFRCGRVLHVHNVSPYLAGPYARMMIPTYEEITARHRAPD